MQTKEFIESLKNRDFKKCIELYQTTNKFGDIKLLLETIPNIENISISNRLGLLDEITEMRYSYIEFPKSEGMYELLNLFGAYEIYLSEVESFSGEWFNIVEAAFMIENGIITKRKNCCYV